jgi:hypothetical protein
MTATSLPTLDPDAPLTSDGAATATATFTLTPTSTLDLPPIPDFDEVLTFGGGGADEGDDIGCEYPEFQPAIVFTHGVDFCLWGVHLGIPFQLTFFSLDGVFSQSIDFFVDQHTLDVHWGKYQVGGTFAKAAYTDNGTVVKIRPLFAGYLPGGEWQVVASGNGFQASTTFNRSEYFEHFPEREGILVLDSRSKDEIVPWYSNFGHAIWPKENGKADIIGKNFPPSTQIFVITYIVYDDLLKLQNTQTTTSDSSGVISLELDGPLRPGEIYMVVAVSDISIPIGIVPIGSHLPMLNTSELPLNYVQILPLKSIPDLPSCPNAPPQRLTRDQRGYVCTQEDSVHLRNSPARSASTFFQLRTGSRFTVIDGYVCADNWSWWLIETDEGFVGWIAEGGDEVDPYFICPLP